MSKFNIGDKVRIVDLSDYKSSSFFEGDTGIIVGLSPDEYDYEVQEFDGIETGWFFEHEIGPLRVRNNALARAVYKDNIEKEDKKWLYLK